MMKRFIRIISGIMIGIGVLTANSALHFNGIDEYVQLSEVLPIGSSSSSIEAWVRIPVVGNGNLAEDERVGIVIGNWGIGSDNVALEVHAAGQVRFYWNNGEYDLKGIKDLRDGSWHHLAAVRDKSNNSIYVYVDGVLEIENPGAGTDINITLTHRIGIDNRTGTTVPFHGEIDELRVWNTARTQSQIREFMCEDVSSESGLTAYYRMSDGSGTALSDDQGTNTGTLVNMDNGNWLNDNQIPDGDGSSTPYEINGLNQLYWLSQNSAYWSDDFEQVIDITATATESWDGGAGFTPVGNSSIKFNGTYNGNDHTITGLTINRTTTDKVALIGWTSSGATLSNIHLTNVNISGDGSSGSIVGYIMAGDVSQCSSSGTVLGVNYVGGLVGQMANGSISECFSSVSVSSSGQYAGGLNGLFGGGTISNCYASGDVNGTTIVGGLIGSAGNNTSATNCYSSGSVGGTSNVGGLIGYAAPEDEFFGSPAAVVTGCFWDTEASGNATSDAGTGKTTAEMKTLSTYTDSSWDYINETVNGTDDYWGINTTEHDGYPFLSWEDYTHNYSDTPLPVTLASFKATDVKGKIELTWTTESETENLGYVLERKVNNSDWREIASYVSDAALQGHGTTSETHDYVFTDHDVIAGLTYEYKLSDVSESNVITELAVIEVAVDASDDLTPANFGLTNAYPNPFNPVLTIQYNLTENAQTTINILNMMGQTVAVLDNGIRAAGSHELQWQADNAASGIYFVQLQCGDQLDFQKVLLVK